MTGLLMKRGKLETDTYTGRRPFEDTGRDWSDVSTHQGMPKIAGKASEARGEIWNRVSLMVLTGSNPANTLISDS